MRTRLNLQRHPRRNTLLGILIALIGVLMFYYSDKTPEQLVFGFILMVGGVVTTTYFNRLVIDTNTGELIHQRGLLLPMRSKRYPLRKIKAINLSEKTVRKHNEKERTTYPIRLSGIRNSVVLKHRSPWFSRVLAEQLARRIRVPLVNRVYGVSTTRASDELDTPLIDRWIRDSTRFEKPAIPHDTTLKETQLGDAYELSIRAQFPKLKYLVILSFVLASLAVVDTPLSNFFHHEGFRVLAGFLTIFGVVMLAFIGHSNLKISANEVSFRQGYFPIRYRLRMQEIEEMIIVSDGITLVGDAKALWIHWGDSKRDSDYLQAVVPYHLFRLGRHSLQQELSE